MPISADHIATTVTAYLDRHPADKDSLAGLVELLGTHADLTNRKELRGHITAAAVLVNEEGHVLHIRHRALGDKWLLPGGHLEPQDATLRDAARRELAEETGIPAGLVAPAGDDPVRIDVHSIPANEAKGEGAHQHFDFRFVFRIAVQVPLVLQEEEVSGYTWRPLEELTDPELARRVTEALAVA